MLAVAEICVSLTISTGRALMRTSGISTLQMDRATTHWLAQREIRPCSRQYTISHCGDRTAGVPGKTKAKRHVGHKTLQAQLYVGVGLLCVCVGGCLIATESKTQACASPRGLAPHTLTSAKSHPRHETYLLGFVQVTVVGDQSHQHRNHGQVEVVPREPLRDASQPIRHLLVSKLANHTKF